jgi:hypothetical protein
MADMNTGKVITAGLAAGLVINVVESVANLFVLAGPMEEVMTGLGLPPIAGAVIGGFVALGFVLGWITVWTYAAIRPRFGPGPGTAAKASIAVWASFYLLGAGSQWMAGVTPLSLYLTVLVYSLIMMLAAGYVGGMLYSETD